MHRNVCKKNRTQEIKKKHTHSSKNFLLELEQVSRRKDDCV